MLFREKLAFFVFGCVFVVVGQRGWVELVRVAS
jgi:hypothetical protein